MVGWETECGLAAQKRENWVGTQFCRPVRLAARAGRVSSSRSCGGGLLVLVGLLVVVVLVVV